jgi:hypothetical protein
MCTSNNMHVHLRRDLVLVTSAVVDDTLRRLACAPRVGNQVKQSGRAGR